MDLKAVGLRIKEARGSKKSDTGKSGSHRRSQHDTYQRH